MDSAANSNEDNFCLSSNSSAESFDVCSSVFLNDVILAGIFKFFNLEFLKQCSLVCRKWRHIARSFIGKQSRFVIWIQENPQKIPDSSQKIFKICETEIPLTALKLKGFFPLSLVVFQEFLNRMKVNLRELIILECTFVSEYEEQLEYDFTYLLSFMKLKKLHIDCTSTTPSKTYTRLNISFDVLTATEVIILISCNFIVPVPTKKIAAKEVYLRNNRFFRNGKEIDNVIINEFVDFKNGNVKLIGNMTLDLSEVTCVESLDLNITNILNWKYSKWNLNQLILWGPFSYERNQMAIRELTFVTNVIVDLSVLPKTLEKLTFSCWRFCDVYNIGAVCLPNLKYLHLDEKSASSLIRFKTGTCSNLESVEITAFMNTCTFNFLQLPPSVTKLKLVAVLQDIQCAFSLPWNSGSTINIHTLILQNFTWYRIYFLLEILQPKHLIIFDMKNFYDEFHTYWTSPYMYPDSCYRHTTYSYDYFVAHLNSPLYNAIESLTLGKFAWVKFGNAFEKSSLSRIVDKKSEYYVFKNKRGIAVEEIYFKNKLLLS